jgi:hypothetical protein
LSDTLFKVLRDLTPVGVKVKIPSRRSTLIELRDTLSECDGSSDSVTYIDDLIKSVDVGEAEFEPELS